MNRDQIIADLILHGYVPYANAPGWVSIWSEERQQGRMCKFFEDTQDGPAWDVRPIVSNLALHEVPWHRIDNDQLAKLVAPTIPPKVCHNLTLPPNLDLNMDLA